MHISCLQSRRALLQLASGDKDKKSSSGYCNRLCSSAGSALLDTILLAATVDGRLLCIGAGILPLFDVDLFALTGMVEETVTVEIFEESCKSCKSVCSVDRCYFNCPPYPYSEKVSINCRSSVRMNERRGG